MILPLSLVILALSTGSDAESPENESAWTQKFEACDRARYELDIPPLSPAERMRIILKELPQSNRYAITFV
jgi:hypothetical protein